MWNSKVLSWLVVCFLSGIYPTSLAQSVGFSTQELLHPGSKIDARLQPYISVLLPYFPELNGLKLSVRERKQLIPLTTVPSFMNLFRNKKNWKININVSNQSIKLFEPILVKNMPDSAVIGVLGHELSHAKDFYTHKPNYILKVFFWHLNPRKIDKFEYNTDLIAIKSGIGYYLKAWSTHTHTKMAVSDFNRKKDKAIIEKERYMRPETIEKWMKEFPEIYTK